MSKRSKGSGSGSDGKNGAVSAHASDEDEEAETMVAQRTSRRLAKMATDDEREDDEEGDVDVDEDAEGLSELTDLQKLIVSAIVKEGNKATLEQIETAVLQYWSRLRKRDGSKYAYDCKRVVLASLANTSSARPMFQRSVAGAGAPELWSLGERSEKWGPILANFVPGGESGDGKSLSVNSNKRSRRGRNGDGESSAEEGGAGPSTAAGSSKRGNLSDPTELTELQQLMALSILESPEGQATLEEITAKVEPLWGNVHKRDGSVYSGNCERACKASLAYASSAKPLFQRLDAPGYVYAMRDEWNLTPEKVREALKAWPWANGETTAAEETAATDGDDEGKAGEETDNDGISGSEDGSSQRAKRQRTSRRSGSSRNTRTRRGAQ
jgi:hypothetical protein